MNFKFRDLPRLEQSDIQSKEVLALLALEVGSRDHCNCLGFSLDFFCQPTMGMLDVRFVLSFMNFHTP